LVGEVYFRDGIEGVASDSEEGANGIGGVP